MWNSGQKNPIRYVIVLDVVVGLIFPRFHYAFILLLTIINPHQYNENISNKSYLVFTFKLLSIRPSTQKKQNIKIEMTNTHPI